MGNYLQSLRVPPTTTTTTTLSERDQDSEHERHCPLFHDWPLPKWSRPVRIDIADVHSSRFLSAKVPDASRSQGSNLAAESTVNLATDRNNNKEEEEGNKTQPLPSAIGSGPTSNRNGGGKLAMTAKKAIKSAKESIHECLESSRVAGTVDDRADSDQINRVNKTKDTKPKSSSGGGSSGGGSGGKSTGGGKPTTKTKTKEAAHAASSMRKSSHTTNKRVDIMRPQTIDPARDGEIDDQAALKAATNIHTVAGSSSSSSPSFTRKRVPAS